MIFIKKHKHFIFVFCNIDIEDVLGFIDGGFQSLQNKEGDLFTEVSSVGTLNADSVYDKGYTKFSVLQMPLSREYFLQKIWPHLTAKDTVIFISFSMLPDSII